MWYQYVATMADALLAVQATTSLPWWAAIAVPFVLKSLRMSERMVPDERLMFQLSERYRAAKQFIDRRDLPTQLRAWRAYRKSVSMAMARRGFAWRWVLVPPAINIPLFLGFAFAARLLVNYAAPGMDAGGLLWFGDLTAPDTSLALPVAAAASTYTSLHLFRHGRPLPPWMKWPVEFGQLGVILMVPITAQLPAGVFMYWIPSALFTVAQHGLTKSPAFLDALGCAGLAQRQRDAAFKRAHPHSFTQLEADAVAERLVRQAQAGRSPPGRRDGSAEGAAEESPVGGVQGAHERARLPSLPPPDPDRAAAADARDGTAGAFAELEAQTPDTPSLGAWEAVFPLFEPAAEAAARGVPRELLERRASLALAACFHVTVCGTELEEGEAAFPPLLQQRIDAARAGLPEAATDGGYLTLADLASGER